MTPSALTNRFQRLPPILHIKVQNPIPAYSKGAQGLSVLPRVGGIFTAITTSPRFSLRQRTGRYTIRAGRNLPDKEFRYLRTVIVTADIHGDLGAKLHPKRANKAALIFPHWSRVTPYTSSSRLSRELCFW